MEYREYYCGDMTIPEEKRGEFTQRVLTIMDHGGLMATERSGFVGGSSPCSHRRAWTQATTSASISATSSMRNMTLSTTMRTPPA